MDQPTVLSLFSGAGGFDLGMERAGFRTAALCEIDENCRRVLRHRWPDVPLYGDVAQVSGTDLVAQGISPHVVVFGSPCQDLSVASPQGGNRRGLAGERSGLFYEAIRIITEIKEASHGSAPTWAIWENVTGALTSNSGHDFAAVLDALADAGAVAVEWAVLDSQFFGVPQRRRRVFVLACFSPRASLLGPEPLLDLAQERPRHPAPSRPSGTEQGDRASTAAEGSIGGSRADGSGDRPVIAFSHTAGKGWDPQASAETFPTIRTNANSAVLQPALEVSVFDGTRRGDFRLWTDVAPTLKHRMGTGGGQVPHISQPSATGVLLRRLLPVECERLMGWTDDHTLWGADGKGTVEPISDTRRLRMMGNGVVAPVAEWLGTQILRADARLAEIQTEEEQA